ncbi:MAG: GNAT family N-acetyltransferase [Chloroflexi bacterium]|nr:GNAT family N-acetyltransferase [Chloroflexota bacterium]
MEASPTRSNPDRATPDAPPETESGLRPAGPAVTLRPAGEEDEGFLYAVYASTREEELAVTGWSEAQKEAFLRMQFAAQHRHYHTYYPEADYQVILVDGRPAGRIYVARQQDEILLIDIALLPAYRSGGIGTGLIGDLLAEARGSGRPVRLHVEPFNRALRLYQRLGFSRIGEQGLYWLMEWLPPGETGG